MKEQFIEHAGRDILERIREVIRFYQEKGQLVEMHPDTIIRTVASTIIAYIVARYIFVPEADWASEEIEVERIITLLEHGLSPKK